MAGDSPPRTRQHTTRHENKTKRSGGGDASKGKVFNDSVHGHIELHPLLVSIIDTPEFQRLRFIKQLGMCNFVYPGATHTRFEHSVGVSYLAGELVRSLQKAQPHLKINKRDILCVEIAGLCHDLGHGPFSHLFDNLFIRGVREDGKKEHEERSWAMFEHLLEKNDLKGQLAKYKLNKTDMIFIKEQIIGAKEEERKGRKKKTFLYDIVANKRNGIDVDKWDYFARDSLYLGIGNSFDWRRFLKFARVQVHREVYEICTRDKEINNLYDMFNTRYMIHKRACKHRVTHILEKMMADALEAANPHLRFSGENGRKRKMSEAIDDMEAFSKMTDNVMWVIFSSTNKKLKKSKDIVKRIMERDLYPYVGETPPPPPNSSECWREEIHELLDDKAKEVVKKSDIIIQTASFDYGMGDEDPIAPMLFYRKSKTDSEPEVIEGRQLLKDSMALPRKFSEKVMRVCIRNKQEQVEQVLGSVREAFQKWCEKRTHLQQTRGSSAQPSTPTKKGKLSPRRSPRKRRRLDF